MATARFTVYIAPVGGRPGRPLSADSVIDAGTRFGWRMLAANNREVARSSTTFADLSACVEAVGDMQRQLFAGLLVATRTGRADWTWRLRISGTDVATSSRTYQRRLQCEAAGALFLELVPDAEIVGAFDTGPTTRSGAPIVSRRYGRQCE